MKGDAFKNLRICAYEVTLVLVAVKLVDCIHDLALELRMEDGS